MTNPDLTLIAALLDRSGSGESCRKATESGFDAMVAKHRSEPGEAVVTLAMFDDEYENVYAYVPINEVPTLSLVPRSMTAMLDAIGRFVTEIGQHLSSLEEAARPGTVICLIMTDGLENASQEWSWGQVKCTDHPAAHEVRLVIHVPRGQHRRGNGGRPHRGAAGDLPHLRHRRRRGLGGVHASGPGDGQSPLRARDDVHRDGPSAGLRSVERELTHHCFSTPKY
jgi:hypothetical protein